MKRESGNIQDISRLNDQAPPGPDHTSSSESHILGNRELFSWSVEIANACEDETPLLSRLTLFLTLRHLNSECGDSLSQHQHRAGMIELNKSGRIYLHNRSPIPFLSALNSFSVMFYWKEGEIPEMHSLQSNRTIPHPLKPTLLNLSRRSRTLPSLPLKTTPKRPRRVLSLSLRSEELRAECWAGGAEEGVCWRHFRALSFCINSSIN